MSKTTASFSARGSASRRAVFPRCFLLFALAAVLAASGCRRETIAEYAVAKETQELPELHRKQIQDALKRYFGTPATPVMREVAEPEEGEEDAEEEDAAAAEEGGEGEASATEPAMVDMIDPLRLAHGAEVYRARCAGCHGDSGDGQGEAAPYLVPKPRDYRRGIFKFTSTPYGLKPARHDLVRTIRRGAKGTSMPAFPWMAAEDIEPLIDYIILLAQRGQVEEFLTAVSADYDEDEPLDVLDIEDGVAFVRESWETAESEVVLPVTAEPAYDDESIIAGRQAFLSRGCSKCHGEDGRGQTAWLDPAYRKQLEEEGVTINYDAWNEPAPAADLTARMLHGGRRPIDIYRRIHTGINGTPMPAFGQALQEEPDTIWQLVHYVRSIVEDRKVDFPPPPEAPAGDASEPAADAPTAAPADDAAPADAAPADDATEASADGDAPPAEDAPADGVPAAGDAPAPGDNAPAPDDVPPGGGAGGDSPPSPASDPPSGGDDPDGRAAVPE